MSYLSLNLKAVYKNSLPNLRGKGVFFSFVSLLFVFVLLFSSVVSIFSDVSFFASGAEPIKVGTQTELRNAVVTANGHTVIALTADISLTDSALNIPAGKDITLVSDKVEGFWKLIGAANQATISVDGILVLNSLIVTVVFDIS